MFRDNSIKANVRRKRHPKSSSKIAVKETAGPQQLKIEIETAFMNALHNFMIIYVEISLNFRG